MALMDGRVRGVIPDGWVQLRDRSSREEVIFHIQNPADEGTEDAANAAILVPPKWPTVQAATDGMLAKISAMPGGVVVSNLAGSDGKRVILARIFIEKTPYVVMVCIGTKAGLVVLAHASYPLLEATPPGWEDAMLHNYKAVLSSLRVDDAPVFPGADPTSTVNE